MTKNRRRVQRYVAGVACVLWWAASDRTLGQSSDARLFYERGLRALHLFEYEDANEAFAQAQRLDPGFAPAYWGEAMTYYQTLWRKEDIAAARQVLARLAPSPAARVTKAKTATEKGLIAAVDVLF